MKALEIIFTLFLASIIIGAIIDNVTVVLVSSLAMIVIVVIAIWKKDNDVENTTNKSNEVLADVSNAKRTCFFCGTKLAEWQPDEDSICNTCADAIKAEKHDY